MLPLDIERFWKEDEIAHRDNCFSPEATQVALGIRMSPECVYTELGEPGKPWLQEDPVRARDLFRRYNDKAERIVGIRLLNEHFPTPEEIYPPYRRIGEWFGGRYIENNISDLLETDIKTPQELEKMLDRLERTDLREFMLPPGWEVEKAPHPGKTYDTQCLRCPAYPGAGHTGDVDLWSRTFHLSLSG
jgi:uroporphyrinogen decarboxylase